MFFGRLHWRQFRLAFFAGGIQIVDHFGELLINFFRSFINGRFFFLEDLASTWTGVYI
jgi:hypothetical protein